MSDQQQVAGHPPVDASSARLRLFGYAPTEAAVVVEPRGLSWRLGRAALIAVAALGLATLAALVPPHVPWAAAVLLTGAVLAIRRLRERRTLVSLRGSCPGCGGALDLAKPARLRAAHRFPCAECGRILELAVADGRRA
jgi:hypothetical protein